MITYKYDFDLVPNGVPTIVHLKQYQTDAEIEFHIVPRSGSMNIGAVTSCTVRGTKLDGRGFEKNAYYDSSDNTVSFHIEEQMTAIAGKNPFELVMQDSSGKMITATFYLHIQKSALDANTIDGNSVIESIDNFLTNHPEYYTAAVDDIVIVDDEQPSSERNKLWIDGDSATVAVVPTYEEFEDVVDSIGDLDELETTAKTDLVSAINEAAQSGGSAGLTADIKDALLACFQNVAWVDDDGQDYYDALEAALYPPSELVSISAVYTQGFTVYEDTPLNDLKEDLVVTAIYSDSSTKTVTNYTLSGTLTEGTSTITVSYSGKTATFTVTVSSGDAPKYPLANGSYDAGYVTTVTNRNHVELVAPTVSSPYAGDVVNISHISQGSTISLPKWFSLEAGDEVVITILNFSRANTTRYASLNFITANSTDVAINVGQIKSGTTYTTTIESDVDIGCACMTFSAKYANSTDTATSSFDLQMEVNGVKYI